MLHSRNAVRIVRHEHDALNAAVCRIGRDVEADPHINPFLFEVRVEVLVCQPCGLIDWRSLWFISPKFENATSHGEQVLAGQFFQPLVRSGKRVIATGHRQSHRSSISSAIVVKNPQNLFIRKFALLGKAFNESGIVLLTGLLALDPEKTAVDQNYYFLRRKM